MKSEVITERSLAYIRVVGPYGENYESALDRLYQWAGEHNVQGGQCLFIYHDDPEYIAPEKCTTDLCLTVPPGTVCDGDIAMQQLPAGRYCTVRGIVKSKLQYGERWHQLKGEAITAGLMIDDRPCFELYHSYDLETHVADVGFYLAVKDGTH
ncbi:AraC family transcriptional regulator [Photobacterium nomapromontoriensis]|uniref:AraC family transcriptional regulator n=1 Tax=Photobacterium nomapromontoriensis TaxID=2910237 RepID=UPI003D0AA0FA